MQGKTVGRYKITSKLGEGGMGSVWEAFDPILGRPIAVKFLADRYQLSKEARQRFLREARSASVLDHPGIATVYDAGESDGQIFIAFKMVRGRTLADILSSRAMTPDEAVHIALETAEALAHAHQKGIIHRDISSRNIMIDESGRVVIVDFGLALPEGETRLTDPQGTPGTLPYMPPEVLKGKTADRKSDLYSLGVVLYQMLTNQLPFQGEHQAATVYSIVNEEALPPSSLRTGLSQDLDRLMERLLAKDPELRPQNASELTRLLRLVHSGKGPVAETLPLVAPADTGSKFRTGGKFSLKRRRILGALGVAVVATVAVLQLRGGDQGATAAYASVAVLPFQIQGDDPESRYLSDGTTSTLTTRLAKMSQEGGLRVAPWYTARRFVDGTLPLQDIAREMNVEALVTGWLRRQDGRIQVGLSLVQGKSGLSVWSEEYEGPDSDLFGVWSRVAVDLASHLQPGLRSPAMATLREDPAANLEAFDFYLKGVDAIQGDRREDKDRALEFFQKALQLDPDLAEAYAGIGTVYYGRYFFGWEGGWRNIELAQENYERALELDPELAYAYRGLIRVFYEKWDSKRTLELGRQAMERCGRSVASLMAQVESIVLISNPNSALPLIDQVLEYDPVNEGAYWFRVIAFAWAGRYQETVEAGNEYYRRFGEDPEVQLWMATAHYHLRQKEEADYYIGRSLENFGKDSNGYVTCYAALIYRGVGKPAKADSVLAAGIEDLERKVEVSPDNVRMLGILSGCLGLAERWVEADECLDRFHQMLEKTGAVVAWGAMYYSVAHATLPGGDLEKAASALTHWPQDVFVEHLIEDFIPPDRMQKLLEIEPGLRDLFDNNR